MSADYEVGCPMPDCTEALYVTWHLSYGLAPGDVVGPVPKPEDHHSGSWEIECAAGHTVLLPGDTGCGCDDPGGECPHAFSPASDAFDWSDDYRTLRPHDMDRLRALIAALSDPS